MSPKYPDFHSCWMSRVEIASPVCCRPLRLTIRPSSTLSAYRLSIWSLQLWALADRRDTNRVSTIAAATTTTERRPLRRADRAAKRRAPHPLVEVRPLGTRTETFPFFGAFSFRAWRRKIRQSASAAKNTARPATGAGQPGIAPISSDALTKPTTASLYRVSVL